MPRILTICTAVVVVQITRAAESVAALRARVTAYHLLPVPTELLSQACVGPLGGVSTDPAVEGGEPDVRLEKPTPKRFTMQGC